MQTNKFNKAIIFQKNDNKLIPLAFFSNPKSDQSMKMMKWFLLNLSIQLLKPI